jgi:hypothetical protein
MSSVQYSRKILEFHCIININIFSIISIEYIEIKIPSRKEAYKFPVKRSLGVFFEGFILYFF